MVIIRNWKQKSLRDKSQRDEILLPSCPEESFSIYMQIFGAWHKKNITLIPNFHRLFQNSIQVWKLKGILLSRSFNLDNKKHMCTILVKVHSTKTNWLKHNITLWHFFEISFTSYTVGKCNIRSPGWQKLLLLH